MRYVALGDSTGAGFGVQRGMGYVDRLFARLQPLHPSVELINLSSNGATAAVVRERQLLRAVDATPQLASVFVGVNDLWRLVEPADFRASLCTIVERLRATGAVVVTGTLPNVAHAPAARNASKRYGFTLAQLDRRIAEFNQAVRACAEKFNASLVDLFHAVDLAEHPEYFSSDGFHPSAAGHAAWADALWPTVERELGAIDPA